MKLIVDMVWMVWGIGASVYDYIHTSALEERIRTLENVLTIHQILIVLLTAGLVLLVSYVIFRNH